MTDSPSSRVRMQLASPQNQFAIPLRVLFVNSLNSFYFVLEEDYEKLDQLMLAMKHYYASPLGAQLVCPNKLTVGCLYALLAYDEWYRARLISGYRTLLNGCNNSELTFYLIDFGEVVTIPSLALDRVARLLKKFCELESSALFGKLANVYPRPDSGLSADKAFYEAVRNRVMYGFCRRITSTAPPTNSSTFDAATGPTKLLPDLAYHLELFFVPTGLSQTELHPNGLDGRLLKACLVHTRQDHLETMHAGFAYCDYCASNRDMSDSGKNNY